MNGRAIWHLIYTKPRQEKTARDQLEKQGFTTYLPELIQTHRSRVLVSPLFPRYLFVRLTPGIDDWTPIRSTRGVSSLVRTGINAAQISDQLIENIRKKEGSDGLHRLPARTFNSGDRIRLVSGPFADCEAIFYEQRAENRVIILLGMIGKQNRVEVPADNIARF